MEDDKQLEREKKQLQLFILPLQRVIKQLQMFSLPLEREDKQLEEMNNEHWTCPKPNVTFKTLRRPGSNARTSGYEFDRCSLGTNEESCNICKKYYFYKTQIIRNQILSDFVT